MSYELITQYTSPNQTPGRPWGINKIVIHWWGDPNTHPTFDNVVHTLCSPARGASAHYVVEAGRVACLVQPKNRAWHAGDGIGSGSQGNDRGIGIECNPRQSDGDYQTIAELIRDIRAVYGDLPLHPHREFNATRCPGTYDLDRLDRLARHTEVNQEQTRQELQEGKTMTIIQTTTPWNTTAYALIGEITGARALSDIEALSYANAYGRVGKVNWDMYNLLVRQSWERHNAFMQTLGKTVGESVEDATQRVINATKQN